MEIGEFVTLGVATPITRVIFDYNRSRTCVRVNTKYNSFTDEIVMPLKKGCMVWICSKIENIENYIFRVFKMREEDAILKKELIVNSFNHIDALKEQGEIDEEMKKFLEYAINKLA